jgi:dihydrofolate reductase
MQDLPPSRPRIILIAGVARNGTIGRDDQLLWHLPEDLAHFRRHTLGHPVLMGRKTWDSLPPRFRPLPGRHNLVLSRQPGLALTGATTVASLAEAWQALAGSERIYVIGGAQIYQACLPLADELLLTEVDRDFAGDAHFPDWRGPGWVETFREAHHAAPPNDFDFAFVRYERATLAAVLPAPSAAPSAAPPAAT